MGGSLHPLLPASHADLLEGAHVAHIATVRPDGAPQSSVVRFAWDGRRIRITTTRSRQRRAGLEHEGRVSVSIHDPDSPLRAIEVRGRVVDVTRDDEAEPLAQGLQRRSGTVDPIDDAAERVIITVEPTKIVVSGGQVVASDGA